ncbi:LysR family transcriptional regulator [uncultured Paenalcaligenes sp.]|uniref:LysR family transcriptional regulator n=1 Tax=uncultured Paenalcaligenes sp. TaxID=1588925 RepID=UPI00261F57DC|nr:LysR family transcriptional regulator [uncultured Paenalcaligenes sp.]
MNISLRQLRAFVELAKTESFTVAAQNLFITQSALSSLIKQMELSLGLQLFDRSTRRVHLSDVGKDLFPLVDKILLDLGSVLDEAASLKALKKGLVRIAAPQLLSSTVLPEVIAQFQRQYPDIQVQLHDCGVEQVANKVLASEVDFGIGPDRDSSADITATLLFESPFHLVFPPNHPLAQQPRITWQCLQEQSLILLQGQFTKRLSGDLDSTEYGPELNLRPAYLVSFMSTALSMVNSGLGLTVCMPYARPLVDLYGLQMHQLDSPAVYRRFYVYERSARTLSPAAEHFKHALFHFINQHS